MLDPGSYYLEITPDVWHAVADVSNPYYLYIPPGKPIVYAGSFEFEKVKRKQGFWKTAVDLNFGILHLYSLKPLGVQNEMDEARQIAKESLSQFGDITASFPVAYDDLSAAVINVTNRHIAEVGSVRGSPFTTGDVGIDRTMIASAPFWAPGAFALSASQSTPMDTEKDKEQEETSKVVGLWLVIAASPFIYVADKTVGEAARKQWAPYEAKIEKEFDRFHFEQKLADEVSNKLSSANLKIGDTNFVATCSNLILQIQPYRILLRETRFRRFALEVAVCVRLFDANTKIILWEHDYVYTDFKKAQKEAEKEKALEDEDEDGFSYFLIPYETLIKASSTLHKLDEFKKADGIQLFSIMISPRL